MLNGSGTYVKEATFNPVAPGTVILSDWANYTYDDIASTLNVAFYRDGQAPMTGVLKMISGSTSTPALAFNAQTNLGLYRKTTSTLAITAASADIAVFSPSGVSFPAGITGGLTIDILEVTDDATINDLTATGTTELEDVTVDSLTVTDDATIADLTATGTTDISGTTTIDGTTTYTATSAGSLTIDTSAYTPTEEQPWGAQYKSTAVYENTDTYGSGSFAFIQEGIDNNQPNVFFQNNVSDSALGNTAGVEIVNIAGGYHGGVNPNIDTDTHIEASIELVAPMTDINAWNGKLKIGSVSGRTSGGGATDTDGFGFIGTRAGDLSPSPNGRFENNIRIYTQSSIGKGWVAFDGSGLLVQPIYDYSVASEIRLRTAYQDAITTNRTDANGKTAQTLNYSSGTSGRAYSHIRAAHGPAQVYIESDDGTADSELYLRGNWSTTGSGSSTIYIYTDNTSSTPSGWIINATGNGVGSDTSNLFFTKSIAGVKTTVAQINKTSNLHLYNGANPSLILTSNTSTTGRAFELISNGSDSAFELKDVTNGVLLLVGYSLTAAASAGKITAKYGLQVGNSSNPSYATAGTAQLSSGVVTVSTAAINSTSKIFVTLRTPGGTLGAHYAVPSGSRVNGTSFDIKAMSTSGSTVTTDTSTVDWFLIDAA